MSARKIAHDLANKLQCVSSFLDLEEYAKARRSTREAVQLLGALRQWLELEKDADKRVLIRRTLEDRREGRA
jgi:hypothetical protein